MKIKILPIEDFKIPQEVGDIYVLKTKVPMEQEDYFNRCKYFAASNNIYLVTSAFRYEEYLAMAMVFPNGDYVIQKASFLRKGNEHLKQFKDVTIFETPWGKSALCCDVDIFQPQYSRLATLKGAKLIFASFYEEEDLMINGPWSSVQSNCVGIYVNSNLNSQLLMPCATTKNLSGLSGNEGEIDDLDKAYESFKIFHCLNRNFCKRHQQELMGGDK